MFCTEHGSITAVLCVKYQKDTSTEKVVIDKRDFARNECQTGLGGTDSVVTSHYALCFSTPRCGPRGPTFR